MCNFTASLFSPNTFRVRPAIQSCCRRHRHMCANDAMQKKCAPAARTRPRRGVPIIIIVYFQIWRLARNIHNVVSFMSFVCWFFLTEFLWSIFNFGRNTNGTHQRNIYANHLFKHSNRRTEKNVETLISPRSAAAA